MSDTTFETEQPTISNQNDLPNQPIAPIITQHRSSSFPVLAVLVSVIVILSLGTAGFFGYQYYSLKATLTQNKSPNDVLIETTPVISPSETSAPKVSTLSSTLNEKIYTNTIFPSIKIKYDSSWTFKATEKSSQMSGVKDIEVTLQKDTTTLTYNLVVGTPMGGAPNCYSVKTNPYTVITEDLIRISGLSTYGDLYWKGESYGHQLHSDKMEAMKTYAPELFACQKTNDCICHSSMDNETYITSTAYPIPPNEQALGQNKTYGALVKIYVKQTILDKTLLQEADKLVLSSIGLSK